MCNMKVADEAHVAISYWDAEPGLLLTGDCVYRLATRIEVAINIAVAVSEDR